MLRFDFLNKDEFAFYAKDIFDILAENMSVIAPTGNTYEEDYSSWFAGINHGLKEGLRQIILIYSSEALIGYFQYFANNQLLMMEEIQLKSKWHGKENIFRELYGFVFSILPPDIQFVEAYANKQNEKSNGILLRLGLMKVGETKSGRSYHYKGDFANLLSWYNRR